MFAKISARLSPVFGMSPPEELGTLVTLLAGVIWVLQLLCKISCALLSDVLRKVFSLASVFKVDSFCAGRVCWPFITDEIGVDHIKSDNYSVPAILGCSIYPSGLLETCMTAFPRMRQRENRWKSCLVAIPLSSPDCLARAEASRLSWIAATLCNPPSVSAAMGRKEIPCSWQLLLHPAPFCQRLTWEHCLLLLLLQQHLSGTVDWSQWTGTVDWSGVALCFRLKIKTCVTWGSLVFCKSICTVKMNGFSYDWVTCGTWC